MIFKKSYIGSFSLGIISFLLLTSPAFAHIIVYPKQVGIAQTQVFDVTVPTEKDNPTVALKLLIPNGVQDVIPNVKVGWTITVVKKEDTVTEIDWTNGSIPPDKRDDFYFQAQVAPTPTTLQWKAYQTYQDGTVVAWDVNPAQLEKLSDAQQDALVDKENKGEYSTTTVINDLTNMPTTQNNSQLPITFSIVALALSALSFGMAIRRNKNN